MEIEKRRVFVWLGMIQHPWLQRAFPTARPDNGVGRLNSVDVLSLLTILLLTVLVAVFRRELHEQARGLAGIFASLMLFIALAAVLAPRHAVWRVMHDFSPALIIPVVFNAVGPIIELANSTRWDATFAALDARLFGVLPTLWRGTLGRPSWFTDLAYVAYCGYYVAPVVLGIMFYRREPRTDFRTLVFTVLLTFYISYIGYGLFPTVGPRPALGAEPLVIGGGVLSHAVRLFLEVAERNRTDAFPSGHTAGALVCLYFAWRISPRVFVLFIPVAIGTIFSTVYLHYHYVVDVVAGAGVACVGAWLGPRLQLLLEPRAVRRRLVVRLGID